MGRYKKEDTINLQNFEKTIININTQMNIFEKANDELDSFICIVRPYFHYLTFW